MSGLGDYWAKSPARGAGAGEALTAHLAAAFEAVRVIGARTGRLDGLDSEVGERFWRIAALAAITHDAGKVAQGFQRMVKGQVRTWPQRHEVLSLGFLPALVADPATRHWVATAVATHHRSIVGGGGGDRRPSLRGLYGSTDDEEFADQIGAVDATAVTGLLDWVARTAGLPAPTAPDDVITTAHRELMDLIEYWERPAPARLGLTAVLLQGALTLADHLSSAHGQLHTAQPMDAAFGRALMARLGSDGRSPRGHQKRGGEIDGHLILRAPTGSGKTEAGLLWAARQIAQVAADRGGAPRLFYTLPYLASINAMAGRLGRELGDANLVGVAHSRAGSYYLAASIEPEDDDTGSAGAVSMTAARKAVARRAATSLFRETVRVTTPYQLLRGSLAGPVHSGVLIDICNSVFLLDELHAYDEKRLGFILSAMGLWEQLGGRIGVLSATLPQALIALIGESLRQPVRLLDGHAESGRPRHRVQLREPHLTDDAGLAEVRVRLEQGQSVLVVANTVRHAQQIFAELAPLAWDRHGPTGALLLHSRFRRCDRNRVERAAAGRYGSATRPRLGGLLVATQAVEVSLDLDFDALHTSAAPLEAMLQRFGRTNRLGLRPPADVIVHQPEFAQPRRGGAERADGVYPAEATRHAWQILARHQGEVVDEQRTIDWLDEIYGGEWGEQWRKEVANHRDRFTHDMLTFTGPFDDRTLLEEAFDELFEGAEAVLTADLPDYRAALAQAPGAAGRIFAEEYLIPVPHYAAGRYDKELRVNIIDAEYDPVAGLGEFHSADEKVRYATGEIL